MSDTFSFPSALWEFRPGDRIVVDRWHLCRRRRWWNKPAEFSILRVDGGTTMTIDRPFPAGATAFGRCL